MLKRSKSKNVAGEHVSADRARLERMEKSIQIPFRPRKRFPPRLYLALWWDGNFRTGRQALGDKTFSRSFWKSSLMLKVSALPSSTERHEKTSSSSLDSLLLKKNLVGSVRANLQPSRPSRPSASRTTVWASVLGYVTSVGVYSVHHA